MTSPTSVRSVFGYDPFRTCTAPTRRRARPLVALTIGALVPAMTQMVGNLNLQGRLHTFCVNAVNNPTFPVSCAP